MRRRNTLVFISVLIIFTLAALVVLPIEEGILGNRGVRLGLDLQGGIHIVYKADLEKRDMDQINLLAKTILGLYDYAEELERYQNALAQEICPNISAVAGHDIAAKLVAHVGSLNKLGMMPSSTIQVLGAEKALFKHLKNRKIAPPKHGIIFQHPRISSSPKTGRGKIARALANKIALAARADAFTKHFIADDLKKDFDKRYNEIMEQYKKGKK